MKLVYVLHNPRCRKSREALSVLEKTAIPYQTVDYLSGVLSEEDIRDLLNKLKLPAESIVRKGEALYKEEFKGKNFNTDEWISILQKNPKLIERPILYNKKDAIIGRPIENVVLFIKRNI